MTLLPLNALGSPDRRDPELLTDLSGKSIVNLAVPRYRNLGAISRIQDDRVTATFAEKLASMLVEVAQQFVAFHLRAVPA
jgi:hypothetical protein